MGLSDITRGKWEHHLCFHYHLPILSLLTYKPVVTGTCKPRGSSLLQKHCVMLSRIKCVWIKVPLWTVTVCQDNLHSGTMQGLVQKPRRDEVISNAARLNFTFDHCTRNPRCSEPICPCEQAQEPLERGRDSKSRASQNLESWLHIDFSFYSLWVSSDYS